VYWPNETRLSIFIFKDIDLETRSRDVFIYTKPDEDGDEPCPFDEWLDDLSDTVGKGQIEARLDHFEEGLFGDCKLLDEGVWEARIHYGPGYRIYYVMENNDTVMVLCGGLKKNQKRDIKKAKQFWKEYRGRNHAK